VDTRGQDIVWVNPHEVGDIRELNQRIFRAAGAYVCIAIPEVWQRANQRLLEDRLKNVQVVHAGLRVGGESAFEELTAVSFNWNFLAPDKDRDNYSWKATAHLVAFHTETFRAMSGLDYSFSVTASVAEFCYRVMKSGGLVQYVASLIPQPPALPVANVTRDDVVRFAQIHLSPNHARLLKAFYLFRFKPVRFPLKSTNLMQEEKGVNRIVHEKPVRVVDNYTAIIPTILRYDYIGKSIESLLIHEYPPKEIIVVDQSPAQKRQPLIYQQYIEAGLLRVFYLDEAGQSTSRNLAIQEANTEWLLFFEDDTEAWPEMMREHRYLMEHSNADVSTGVSLAPWKDQGYIPERLRKYHVSDVLATGNCFMRRDTAREVGGLHMAFNRGSGADDDFGRRLFLAGKLIIFNYKAIQTHHKAPSGGMRVHGAWWRNRSKLLEAYPPQTQAFMIRKYYHSKFWFVQFVLFYLQAKKVNSLVGFILILLFSPVKLFKAIRSSSALLKGATGRS
jgi:GT2 family glycosyltransferase